MNSKNTALLVIDVVNLCCHPKCERKKWNISFKNIRKMVSKLINFIDRYKEKFGGKIIYVNCVKWDEKHVAKNIKELYKDPKCRFYSKNPVFSEKFYKVKPEKQDLVITKNTYDAFSNPKLNKYLKKNKIKNLIITGVFGEGCVNATINGGFAKGYNFIILKDLIETIDGRQKLLNLLKKETWPKMFGKAINSKEFFTKPF